jgi:hypothetical protein
MTMADIDEKVPRPSRQGQYQLSHSCFLIPSKHNSSYKPLGPTKGENSVELFFKKIKKKKKKKNCGEKAEAIEKKGTQETLGWFDLRGLCPLLEIFLRATLCSYSPDDFTIQIAPIYRRNVVCGVNANKVIKSLRFAYNHTYM